MSDVACGRCGLRLRGPLAVELADVERRIVALQFRRNQLLWALRPGSAGTTAAPGPVPPGIVPTGTANGPSVTVAAPPARTGQQLLLGLGALLVLVASLVFLAVNWSLLGPAGQMAVALAAAASSAALAEWTARRSLRSSAEAFAALAMLLLTATAIGARLLELFPGLDAAVFWAVAAAMISALAFALSVARPLVAYRLACLLAAQIVAPAVVLAFDAPLPLWLAAVSLGGVATWLATRRWQPVAGMALALGAWSLVEAVGYVAIWAAPHPERNAAVVLLTAAAAATLISARPIRVIAAALAGLAASAALYRWVDPVAALALGVALLVASSVDRRVQAMAVQAATLVGLGATVLAAAIRGDQAVLAAAAVLLWAFVVRHLLGEAPMARAAAPLAGPALVLSVVALCAWSDSGRPLGVAAVSVALAVQAVVAVELWPDRHDVERLLLLGGTAVGSVGVWVVTWAALVEPNVAAPPLQRALSCSFGAAAAVALHAAWRLRVPLVAVLVATLASAATWSMLASSPLRAVEYYSVPAAGFFALAGWSALRRHNSALSFGPAAVLALGPTSVVAVLDAQLARLAVGLAASALVAIVSVRTRRGAPLLAAAAAVGWLVIGQLNNWSAYVPRWAVLAFVGAVLLFAGVTFEASRRLARATVTFVRSLD